MSSKAKENQAGNDGEADRGSPALSGVADFLQAPKKQQRNYIVFAAGPNLTAEMKDSIAKYLEGLAKIYTLVQPRSAEDLARQVSRQIHMMIVDDSFAERTKLLKLVRFMKEKRTATGLPVTFLTRDPAGLTADYRSELLVHQESDDFIGLKNIESVELVGRIKQAVETRNRRRSRRFKVNMSVSWQTLGATTWSTCDLVDISLHGAQIVDPGSDVVFRVKDQVRLQIPLTGQVSAAEGEILRLSARVRRVSLGGSRAGLSFEHLTDRQVIALTQLILGLANGQTLSHVVDNTYLPSLE